MAHVWEEPYISGSRGSGTVFFSGCALGCVFCQNFRISHRRLDQRSAFDSKLRIQDLPEGQDMTVEALVDQISLLADQGVHNLNLVTASQYSLEIPELVNHLRRKGIELPIVWNTGSFERIETLRLLSGIVSVYLPDFKFWDSELSLKLAGSADYARVASQAILEMHRQQPTLSYDDEGLLNRGVALRHLVLPGQHRDSIRILDWIAGNLPLDLPLAIMRQYTPFPALNPLLEHLPDLKRRVTTYEYEKVIEHAQMLGFSRILGQEKSAASSVYTPDF
jgi:putative pyruvate formate lyase activating enzyme